MLHAFLSTHHNELVERCRSRVARRSAPRPTPHEIEHGIPLFLGQLIETLRLEEIPGAIAKPASEPGDGSANSEMAETAAKHGSELLRRGFTVDQVVHDYGDLCQAVTELAVETQAPISAAEFHTFNLCLDNAIAGAVTEFAGQRARRVSAEADVASSERLGSLAHELRNHINTAILAFAAIRGGGVGLQGATAAVVDRSFTALRDLIDGALAEVRLEAGPLLLVDLRVDRLIAEVQSAASMEARERKCEFSVSYVAPELTVHADKLMLCSAVSNLLQNAFKFTRPLSLVSLRAYGVGERVLIEVEDECGGLPDGKAEAIFHSFEQHGGDRSGVGLGLSIARRAVEASGGTLSARDIPGIGCLFTIDLPRAPGHSASRTAG